MKVNDWFEIPHKNSPYMYSANDVPWPLDEWLRLQGKMTTYQAPELAKRWPKEKIK